MQTKTQSNNAAVAYRGRSEREMPSSSQAQNRFMHAVAEGKVSDVPAKVGKDYVAADKGRKIGHLPKHVRKRARKMQRQGMISEKAMAKMTGGE